jgi:hypothetical protein
MRIWSIHPKYLDARGLAALWRETLLAQKVLTGETKGYRNHPQLNRFRQHRNPVGAIATYLTAVYDEAKKRDYNFDHKKIEGDRVRNKIPVTPGQLLYELNHLKKKLKLRDPASYVKIKSLTESEPYPLFLTIDGHVEDWERLNS